MENDRFRILSNIGLIQSCEQFRDKGDEENAFVIPFLRKATIYFIHWLATYHASCHNGGLPDRLKELQVGLIKRTS